MQINDLLEELVAAKHNYAQADKVAKECKTELDNYKQLVIDKLAEIGLKSAKNDDLMVSMVQKPSFKIVNTQALTDWLEEEPTVDARSYFRLDARAIDSLAKEALKKDGLILPGGEFVSSEYLSVKENK